MQFTYKAINSKGEVVQGELTAQDKAAALAQLEQNELTPLSLQPKTSFGLSFVLPKFKRGISTKDVIIFTRSMATLIETGISIDKALEISKAVLKGSPMQAVIDELIEEIKGGSSFASALAKHKRVFPVLYISMIRAAESAGIMNTVLNSLGNYLERSYEFKSNLVSSLIYPAMLFGVSVLSLIVLIVFVVPKFLNMFISMDIEPPLPILIASQLGIFFQNFWWLIVLFLVGVVIWFKKQLKRPDGKLWLDQKLLNLPLVGGLLLKIENARFTRTLGTLLANGVSILQALNITKEIITNEVLKRQVELVYVGVREGEKFASLFARYKNYWHPSFLGLAGIGEETGRLPEMLNKCAQILEKDVEEQLKKVISMVEPLTIIVMGLIVGSLIVSMLSAIFSINDTVF